METVAQKLLRTNLSDLAAKGAEAFGYLLACHWSPRCAWAERVAFTEGLKADQNRFGVHLLGGDTVKTPGPASFSATLMGWVPSGTAISRSGAKAGDMVFVTGTIGDGGLGLYAAMGQLELDPKHLATLIAAYQSPEPRLGFAPAVRAYASASADVSDGLVADLGHIAKASGVGIQIDLEHLPVSTAAQAWLKGQGDQVSALSRLAASGDDYEIILTAPSSAEAALEREAAQCGLRVTPIGRVSEGQGVCVQHHCQAVTLTKSGWTHD